MFWSNIIAMTFVYTPTVQTYKKILYLLPEMKFPMV